MGLFDGQQPAAQPTPEPAEQPEVVSPEEEQLTYTGEEYKEPTTPAEKLVRVVYIGSDNYQDDTYGTLAGGDERTVSESVASELVQREKDGKTLFARV